MADDLAPDHPLSCELRDLVEGTSQLKQVERALGLGGSLTVGGLPGGARVVFLATLFSRQPLLVVLPDEDAVHRLQGDLEQLVAGRALLRNPSLSLYEDDPHELGTSMTLGARLRVLRALDEDTPPAVLTSATALLQALPRPDRARQSSATLEVGGSVDPHELGRGLVDRGYRRVGLVEAPGEFAIRGGIVDLYALGSARPLRVELDGEVIESLRFFEPVSQRSIRTTERFSLPLMATSDQRSMAREDRASLIDHLPAGMAVVLVGADQCRDRLDQAAVRFAGHEQDLLQAPDVRSAWERRALILLEEDAPDVTFPFESPGLGGRDIEGVTNALSDQVARGSRLTLACVNEGERQRLATLFRDSGLPAEPGEGLRSAKDPPGVTLVVSSLRAGLRQPGGPWLLPSSRLFTRHIRAETTARRAAVRRSRHTAVESFADLEVGQCVVHVSHGIALFKGIVRREHRGKEREFIQLEFAEDSLLDIPTDRIGLVRRYVGPTTRIPRLSKLGGTGWRNKTRRAAEAVRDMAAELLEVQAERMVRPGYAFPPDDRWQALFEESFPYTDTPDQVRVTNEVREDMTAPRAMDRVVCGDVGYGKTEIAVRASFRSVTAGRQVAVLAPTTVLAHQHHRTFRERMAAYPVRVEVISRFRTQAEQKAVVAATKRGEVDVLIGTHRILSKDVAFKDLGLVVVDEEQRFGVEHKERIKEFRRTVDILTLTATPIPRTLHMALSGARDISVLQTPPPGRSPVDTRVVRFDRRLIKRAIERELARDGQVFLVHDRVRTIERLATLVRELVPTARVLVVHGQLPENQIEDRMLLFFDHQVDVLVATTLIENGLDVRRANTLIVDRADRFGLAELHQIRGRVGRSHVRAYAYFLLEEQRVLSEIAQRRLRAIEEFSDLGAGFQIAMRDLEIRGAGNVLGAQQSGHIVNVGYDLYCRLLKRAVAELRGELRTDDQHDLDYERDLDLEAAEVVVILDVQAYIPNAYMADAALKIECYRRLASAEQEEDLVDLAAELRDRFGPLPRVLENLFKLRRLRLRAAGYGVLKISRQDRVLQLCCRNRERLEAGIRSHRQNLRPIDGQMLYVRMADPEAPDSDQLDFLLDILAPLEPQQEQNTPLDPQAIRAERQRRLRAKEHTGRTRQRSQSRTPRG